MLKNKYQRILAIVLVVIQLLLVIPPMQSDALIDSQFNIGYTNSVGYTIMNIQYSNPSVETSFSKLADRALKLKNEQYSYSSAIQILTETKTVVGKITAEDYDKYEQEVRQDAAYNGNMRYQFTYESFIMRNVLYAMLKNKASYTEMLKALQIVYDTAVIQSQKGAFRLDALTVLEDIKVLASYTGDNNIAEMLRYVSKYASGIAINYKGTSKISSVNLSSKYQAYVKEQYDKSQGSGKVEVDNGHVSEFAPDGYGDHGTIELPIYGNNDKPFDTDGMTNSNNNTSIADSYLSDLEDLYNGQSTTDKYVLCYTLNKSDQNPTYHKTKIVTKQFITYSQIIEALKTVTRNSPVVYVEDTDAVLVVHDGICTILDSSQDIYDATSITTAFSNLKDFGFVILYKEDIQ